MTSVIDTRVHPSSQLAGFAKADSLEYFLRELLGVDYLHEPLLAPEAESLRAYRSSVLSWDAYAAEYLNTLDSRQLGLALSTDRWGERPALLCSEKLPEHCHRRLAAEFLRQAMPDITAVVHLET